MLEENFPTCTVCEKTLTSDADAPKNKTRYCVLCGMRTESMDKFCCFRCEGTYKMFVRHKVER